VFVVSQILGIQTGILMGIQRNNFDRIELDFGLIYVTYAPKYSNTNINDVVSFDIFSDNQYVLFYP